MCVFPVTQTIQRALLALSVRLKMTHSAQRRDVHCQHCHVSEDTDGGDMSLEVISERENQLVHRCST